MYYNAVKEICQKAEYPSEAVSCLLGVERRLEQHPRIADALEYLVEAFCKDDTADLDKLIPKACALGVLIKENIYTMELTYLLHCATRTRLRYVAQGLPEELYWEGMKDFKWKLLECMAVKNIPGTFVGSWFSGFLRLKRFTLGRFQYEPVGFYDGAPVTLSCGYTVQKGTRFLCMHIPNTGEPLTDELRLDSYRKAEEFFKPWFGAQPMLIRCGSWLLYDRHPEFLPETSNILRFMKDFEIDRSGCDKDFHDAWRLYNAYAKLPVEEWQEDTSLRRAYKQWLLNGNYAGHGEGWVVIADGQVVTHQKLFSCVVE